MAIEIHIRVRKSDLESEYDLAQNLEDKIKDIIPDQAYIPILIIPVEDPENVMLSIDFNPYRDTKIKYNE